MRFMVNKYLQLSGEKSIKLNQQSTCTRCGTCCTKGGPALHHTDIDLVRQGRLPLAVLFTIRMGEWVKDNINGGFVCADHEIIKVRSQDGSSACQFYDNEQTACRIYEDRPLECRLMKCWDTEAIVAIYLQDLISRGSLLSHIDGLWKLVEIHESTCTYDMARRLIADRNAGKSGAAKALDEMIRYDETLRTSMTEKRPETEDVLDFILGRPLRATLPQQFGIRIHLR